MRQQSLKRAFNLYVAIPSLILVRQSLHASKSGSLMETKTANAVSTSVSFCEKNMYIAMEFSKCGLLYHTVLMQSKSYFVTIYPTLVVVFKVVKSKEWDLRTRKMLTNFDGEKNDKNCSQT